ncbi:MAG: thioesterase family protein [Hyphomonadaceae bacterium]
MSETPRPTYFYEEGDGRFAPTSLVVSPWDKRNQGGIPLAGLLAFTAERVPAPAPMTPARFVIDLMHPTPIEAIESRARVIREGRRLQLVEAEIVAGGKVTARASMLRVRVEDSPPSPGMARVQAPPQEARPFLAPQSRITHMVESRLIQGGLEELGGGATWLRLSGDVVRGTPMSPFVKSAIVADFGSGLSAFVDWRRWSFANLDISVHLSRLPAGAWIKLEAETMSAGEGVAIVDGLISDEQGPVGRTHQTLFMERIRS